jgi:hypothetical protein
MSERVWFSIGPVDLDVVEPWIANSRSLVDAVRAHRRDLSILADEMLLDLCESLLDIWSAHARASSTGVFEWSMEVAPAQVLYVVRQWLAIGSLTDDDLARLGVAWAPEWTRPFADALVAGAIAALRDSGSEGTDLLAQLEEG